MSGLVLFPISYQLSWIPTYDGVFREVFGENAVSSNDATFGYVSSNHDRHTPPNPHIIIDDDRPSLCEAL